jgi:hypothetical protein
MRIYRAVWDVVALLTVLTSLVLGVHDPGWTTMIVGPVFVGAMGGVLYLTWDAEAPRLLTAFVSWVLLPMGAASVIFGLPAVLGPWAILTAPVLAVVSPEVVDRVRQWLRRLGPVPVQDRLSSWTDGELELRWRVSAAQLRHPGTTLDRKVALAEERSRLLDEVERRDPEGFQARLAQAGWHVSER